MNDMDSFGLAIIENIESPLTQISLLSDWMEEYGDGRYVFLRKWCEREEKKANDYWSWIKVKLAKKTIIQLQYKNKEYNPHLSLNFDIKINKKCHYCEKRAVEYDYRWLCEDHVIPF